MLKPTPEGLNVCLLANGYRPVEMPLTLFLEAVAHSKSMRQLALAVDDYATNATKPVANATKPVSKAMAAGAGR